MILAKGIPLHLSIGLSEATLRNLRAYQGEESTFSTCVSDVSLSAKHLSTYVSCGLFDNTCVCVCVYVFLSRYISIYIERW